MNVPRGVRGVVAAVCLASCAGDGADKGTADVAAGERALQALRRRLDERIAQEPHVKEVLALSPQSDIVVGLRSALVEDLVQEVARRYLDRVELDLDLEREVEERRPVEVTTPFGRVTAGEWRLHVIIHRVRGALRTRAPDVRPVEGNRLALRLPVVLEGAEGTATAHFEWKARFLGGFVCRDFDVTRRVRGRVMSDEYALDGQFELFAGPQAVLVRPVFPRRRFRLRVDLVEDSWTQVRRALEEQDEILKCLDGGDPFRIVQRHPGQLGVERVVLLGAVPVKVLAAPAIA